MTRAAARLARAAASAAFVVFAASALSACGATPKAIGPEGIDELTIPTPSPDPADFSGDATNAWFPLEPGTRWAYRLYTPAGHRPVVATVLAGRRPIDGIATTAVRWQLRVGSAERTVLVRWYAVDSAGNVWWFGQRMAAGGAVLDRLAPRSWLAGQHGAEAGLVLTAHPRVGDGYFNAEQARVVARRSTVLSTDGTVGTVKGTFRHTVVTRDLSALAPLHTAETFYARGLGLVAQSDTKATSTGLNLMGFRHG